MNAPTRSTRRNLLLLATALAAPRLPWAHGTAGHDRAPAPLSDTPHAWGRQGDPLQARRTIDIAMSDRMRYTPDRIRVTLGETVRLRVRNRGRLKHELVIGTRADLEAHAELMRKHPDMEHDEPYMAHVPPGGSTDIVWTFDRPGEFLYGCLLPGHWQAGMQGTIIVEPRKP